LILDGYIRVSQVGGRGGEKFISPSVQREQIEAWTSSNGSLLGVVFEELDESGGRADRPLLMEAIERVESGESDGLIVAKLDRFGRSLLDGLSAIARIDDAGGTFISVQDGFDLGTSTGKLVLRIMFSIGEWEFERVRTNWDVARRQAVARGLYIARRAPHGYRRGKDRRLEIDPETAPIVREVFERRKRGETFAAISDFLNASELSTETEVPFTESHVRYLIKRPAYRGEVLFGPYRKANAHEPLVDAATWAACQSPPRGPHRPVESLLKGRLRCASCGFLMRPIRTANTTLIYNCPGIKGRCAAPAHVRNDLIDPLVEEMMFGMWRGANASASELESERSDEALAEAERNLAAYRDNPRLQRRLGATGFEAGVASRQREVDRKLLEVSEGRRAVRRPRFDVANLKERWAGLSWDERRLALGEFIDCVIVARGKNSVTERAWVLKRGDGPTPLRPFERMKPVGALVENGIPVREVRRWPPRKLGRELRNFLATRTSWPSYAEFADAGEAILHAQMMSWGGPYYWGHELGLEVPLRMVYWNETLIRNALAPLVEGASEWPKVRELEAIGLIPLSWAIKNSGGMARWAREFGFDFTPAHEVRTEAEVERELIEFVGDRTVFPGSTEFKEAGKMNLYEAARRRGGIGRWRERLGLERGARMSPRSRPRQEA